MKGQEGKYLDIGGAIGIVDSAGTSEPVSAGAGAGVARGEGGDVVEMAGGVSEVGDSGGPGGDNTGDACNRSDVVEMSGGVSKGGDSGGPDGGNAGDACSRSEGANTGVANGDVDRRGGVEHEEGVVGGTV